MNALNDVSSDTNILQIIIQKELQKLKKTLQKNLIFKDKKFPIKIRNIHKIKKTKKKRKLNFIAISFFSNEDK